MSPTDAEYCPGCGYVPCQCRQLSEPLADSIGPQAPTETNNQGGQQSASPVSLVTSFPALAVLKVGSVIKQGLLKYEPDNWRLIPQSDHLNHALAHIFAHCAGDRQDEHLEHAACRLLFALETR